MDFPAIVYRTPGPFGRPGKTYAYQGVADQDALDQALVNGWYESKAAAFSDEAFSDMIADRIIEATKDVNGGPATRDEMDQKARELGIRGYHRMKDGTLAERIAEMANGAG